MHGISICIHNYMQIIKGGKYSFFSSSSIGSKDTFSYPIWGCRSLFTCYFGTKCTKFVILKGRVETITGALMPWGEEIRRTLEAGCPSWRLLEGTIPSSTEQFRESCVDSVSGWCQLVWSYIGLLAATLKSYSNAVGSF